MSRPYGPVQLTAGTMASVDVDPGAAFVVIENSSVNLDLAVSFQVNAPAQTTYVSGFPWNGYIQAGGSKRLTLPPNDGRWTGRIWMYPISVASFSAQTGAGSSYSRAIITTFSVGEEPQDFQGVIRGLDLTSQPRVISVPMASGFTFYKTITLPSTVEPFDAAHVHNAGIVIAGVPAAQTSCSIYLHEASAYALTVGSCQFSLSLWWCDAGNNPLTVVGGQFNFEAWRAGVFGPAGGSVLTATAPELKIGQGKPGNAATVQLFYILTAGGGGMTVSVRFDCSIDLADIAYIGGVGAHVNTAGDLY